MSEKQLHLKLEGDENFDLELNEVEKVRKANDVKILELLELLLANQQKLPDRLWTLDDVGKYLRVSEPTARRAMSMPGAPEAVNLPTQGDATVTRYVAAEIIAYATRKSSRRRRLG